MAIKALAWSAWWNLAGARLSPTTPEAVDRGGVNPKSMFSYPVSLSCFYRRASVKLKSRSVQTLEGGSGLRAEGAVDNPLMEGR